MYNKLRSKVDKLLGFSILESLDSKIDITTYIKRSRIYVLRFTIDKKLFEFSAIEESSNTFDLDFCIYDKNNQCSWDQPSIRSSLSTTLKVYSSFLRCIELLLSNYDVNEFYFLGKLNEPSRVSFYSNQLAPRISKQFKYSLDSYIDDEEECRVYYFTKR